MRIIFLAKADHELLLAVLDAHSEALEDMIDSVQQDLWHEASAESVTAGKETIHKARTDLALISDLMMRLL
jgi:hypothetical protein